MIFVDVERGYEGVSLDRSLSGSAAPTMKPAKVINTDRTIHGVATEQALADRNLWRTSRSDWIPFSLIRNHDNGVAKRVTIMCQILFRLKDFEGDAQTIPVDTDSLAARERKQRNCVARVSRLSWLAAHRNQLPALQLLFPTLFSPTIRAAKWIKPRITKSFRSSGTSPMAFCAMSSFAGNIVTKAPRIARRHVAGADRATFKNNENSPRRLRPPAQRAFHQAQRPGRTTRSVDPR